MLTAHRSKLFVPGNRPERFDTALGSGANAIAIDLEDAVPDDQKAVARQAVVEFLERLERAPAASGTRIGVRLNGRTSGFMIEDLMAVVRPGLATVNVPKVEDPIDVVLCAELLNHLESRHAVDAKIGILATIETPPGLGRAAVIAGAHPRLEGLQFGLGDFAAEMDMEATPERLGPAWMTLVGAARMADIAAYDAAYPDMDDLRGFEAWAREARASGFQGKSCIQPDQVAICNEVFGSSAAEIDEAKAIVEAYERTAADGRGAIAFHGRLIDLAHVKQARRRIARANAGDRRGATP
jgi:citrate lyase subunit beta/citryl-CoA lyase